MADTPYVVDVSTPNLVVVRWPAMANGATGQPLVLDGRAGVYCPVAVSVQLTGTLGVGGNCQIQGSNLPTPTWVALNDLDGITLDMAALGLKGVSVPAYQYRPVVTAGDGNTSLTATMILWR